MEILFEIALEHFICQIEVLYGPTKICKTTNFIATAFPQKLREDFRTFLNPYNVKHISL